MKKFVCEICESDSILKKDGQFVCQNCGTTYTAEEVRKMMQDVPEDRAGAVQETAAAPNQKLLNMLVMAHTAFEAGKLAEAEKYCDKAIEMDEACYSAWFLKARVVGWKSNADTLTLNEAVKLFCVALDSAPEEERDDLKAQAAQEIGRIGVAVLTQTGEAFVADPSTFTLFDMKENADLIVEALKAVMDHGTAQAVPGAILTEMTTVMNQAGASALERIKQAWKGLERPGRKEFDTVKACYDSIEGLFQKVVELSAAYEEQAIAAYKKMIVLQESLMEMRIFRQEKNQETGEMVWIKSNALSDLAITAKSLQILNYNNAITNLQTSLRERKAAEARAAEEAKRQRIQAYWEAHAEEKAQLDAELETLDRQKEQFNAEITELSGQIHEIEKDLNQSLPQDAEIEMLKKEIWNLNKGRLGVGIFNFKGQKEVSAKIEPLKQQKGVLEAQVKAERKRIKEDVKQRTDPLKARITELKKSHTAAENRQSAIHAILTKDPAEVSA